MREFLGLRRKQRVHFFNADLVLLFDPVHQVIGFRKKEFGIYGEETKIFSHSRCHVDQDHPFGAERGRDGDVAAESFKGPLQDLLRSPRLGLCLQLCDLGCRSNAHAITSSALMELASEENSAISLTPGISCRFARRTTSPTTNNVGESRCGALGSSAIVVR